MTKVIDKESMKLVPIQSGSAAEFFRPIRSILLKMTISEFWSYDWIQMIEFLAELF